MRNSISHRICVRSTQMPLSNRWTKPNDSVRTSRIWSWNISKDSMPNLQILLLSSNTWTLTYTNCMRTSRAKPRDAMCSNLTFTWILWVDSALDTGFAKPNAWLTIRNWQRKYREELMTIRESVNTSVQYTRIRVWVTVGVSSTILIRKSPSTLPLTMAS